MRNLCLSQRKVIKVMESFYFRIPFYNKELTFCCTVRSRSKRDGNDRAEGWSTQILETTVHIMMVRRLWPGQTSDLYDFLRVVSDWDESDSTHTSVMGTQLSLSHKESCLWIKRSKTRSVTRFRLGPKHTGLLIIKPPGTILFFMN